MPIVIGLAFRRLLKYNKNDVDVFLIYTVQQLQFDMFDMFDTVSNYGKA